MKEYVEEEEEEEEQINNYNNINNNYNNNINNIYNNNYNNKINCNKTYFVPNNDNNFNNSNSNINNIKKYNSSNISFSPRKKNLSNLSSQSISRNPNLFDYSKNKKIFIPMSVMNLVSFINSQTNENINSIPALNILTKIKSSNNNINQNNIMNKPNTQISLDNSDLENSKILKKYEENYIQMKNEAILAKSAFDIEPLSPVSKKNNNDFEDFTIPYNNNYNITDNNFKSLNNFNNIKNYNNMNSINKSSPNKKIIIFNNTMKKSNNNKKYNMKNNSNNINNYYI